MTYAEWSDLADWLGVRTAAESAQMHCMPLATVLAWLRTYSKAR